MHKSVRGQSIKKPSVWNSEPARERSTLAMVALCSRDFKLYSDTSSKLKYEGSFTDDFNFENKKKSAGAKSGE